MNNDAVVKFPLEYSILLTGRVEAFLAEVEYTFPFANVQHKTVSVSLFKRATYVSIFYNTKQYNEQEIRYKLVKIALKYEIGFE